MTPDTTDKLKVLFAPAGPRNHPGASARSHHRPDPTQVVVLPIPVDPPRVGPGEYAAADAMAMMLERAVGELQPSVVYAPARGDRHPSRAGASRIAASAAGGRVPVYGYQTATSPSFSPQKVLDISGRMESKTAALAEFAEVGTKRQDLDPGLPRAYDRYWGRLKDFGEVEVFEIIQEKDA